MYETPDVEPIRLYHDATKHLAFRPARSPGYLDWANQPDPFRRYEGAELIDLVSAFQAADAPGCAWRTRLWTDLTEPCSAQEALEGLAAVSVMLRFSLGLSAWKRDAWSRWSLRVNPSSGNLHPTEAYLVLPSGHVPRSAGVFHYRADLHALERRAALDDDTWRSLLGALPAQAFLIGLTSIPWREAWKYGERAFRYCQHDIGHAVAALRYAAALAGWQTRLVPGLDAATIGALLGTDRADDFQDAEREEPECLLLCMRDDVPCGQLLPAALRTAGSRATWTGRANILSAERLEWDAIEVAASATRGAVVPAADERAAAMEAASCHEPARDRGGTTATALVLQRRSAVAMTGDGELDAVAFFSMLRRLQPGRAPWDALWWAPRVHLVLFVHRVQGLLPGLYTFARSAAGEEVLRGALRSDFLWERPKPAPPDLPLFLLAPLDVRATASAISCRQDIAGDGFFSAGMLAAFDEGLATYGPAFYRCLFWEAGAAGQVLYLEAEAAGARGTGIGCYFDDAVHELCGIADTRLQSLYHFTVGQPVDDHRLQTEPGYRWERRGEP